MKKAVLLLTIAAFATISSTRADQATKIAKIDEVLKLTKGDQMVTQIIGQMKGSMEGQLQAAGVPDAKLLAAEMEKQILPLMTEKMNWEAMKPKIIKLYDETFTEEELTSMVDFYHTPGGKALVEKMPTLTAKSMAMSQDMMKDIMPDVMRISRTVMEKYVQDHPGAFNKQGTPAPPPAK